jgi:hypothetical protein
LAINRRRGRADVARVQRIRSPKPVCRPLEEPRLSREGIEHGPLRGRALLRWADVLGAVAAEVGEPEGVRTIVFDLLARASRGGLVPVRLDAEPGEAAAELAQRIAAAIGDRAQPSVRRLAVDGVPTLWFPDLESFEEIAAELVRRGS